MPAIIEGLPPHEKPAPKGLFKSAAKSKLESPMARFWKLLRYQADKKMNNLRAKVFHVAVSDQLSAISLRSTSPAES